MVYLAHGPVSCERRAPEALEQTVSPSVWARRVREGHGSAASAKRRVPEPLGSADRSEAAGPSAAPRPASLPTPGWVSMFLNRRPSRRMPASSDGPLRYDATSDAQSKPKSPQREHTKDERELQSTGEGCRQRVARAIPSHTAKQTFNAVGGRPVGLRRYRTVDCVRHAVLVHCGFTTCGSPGNGRWLTTSVLGGARDFPPPLCSATPNAGAGGSTRRHVSRKSCSWTTT